MKLLLALTLCVSAQMWDPPNKEAPAEPPEEQGGGSSPMPMDGGGGAGGGGEAGKGDEEAAPPEAPPVAATLQDASANFGTIVETFLAQNTKEGVWNLRDKRTKKIRRLAFQAVDEKTVREAAKDGHFRGHVKFKDADTGKRVIMEMTVDMSGSQWRVSGAKMLKRQK